MSSKSASDRPWSLAARLTLWYAAASFVLIAASAGFMYWALVHKLESEDDQFMAEKVQLVRVLLEGRAGAPVVLPRDGNWRETNRPADLVHVRVLATDGRTLMMTAG